MTFDEFVRFACRERTTQSKSMAIVTCPLCDKPVMQWLLGHLEEHGVSINKKCDCGCELDGNAALSNYDHYNTFDSPSDHIRECAVVAAILNTQREE